MTAFFTRHERQPDYITTVEDAILALIHDHGQHTVKLAAMFKVERADVEAVLSQMETAGLVQRVTRYDRNGAATVYWERSGQVVNMRRNRQLASGI